MRQEQIEVGMAYLTSRGSRSALILVDCVQTDVVDGDGLVVGRRINKRTKLARRRMTVGADEIIAKAEL